MGDSTPELGHLIMLRVNSLDLGTVLYTTPLTTPSLTNLQQAVTPLN